MTNSKSKPSEAWRQALTVFIIVRIVASLCAFIGYPSIPAERISPAAHYNKPGYSKTFEVIFGHWERWDALWYIEVAQHGYEKGSQTAALMPLYPLSIRFVHFLTRLPWLICGLLISNVAFLVALWLLYMLCELELGADAARRTLWFLALFPGGLFYFAPYSESLYLMLAVLAFLAARRQKWWLAGLSAALLGATRNVGAAIGLPLFIEFVRQYRLCVPANRRVMLPKVAWLLLCPLGILGDMAYWHFSDGDALRFLHAQSNWQREFSWPWTTYFKGLEQAWIYATAHPGGVYILEAFAVSGALVLAVLAFRKLPAAYGVFLWLNMLAPMVMPFKGRMLLCCTRYFAILFPAFMTLAAYTKKEAAQRLVLISFAALFGLSVSLYVTSQWMY